MQTENGKGCGLLFTGIFFIIVGVVIFSGGVERDPLGALISLAIVAVFASVALTVYRRSG